MIFSIYAVKNAVPYARWNHFYFIEEHTKIWYIPQLVSDGFFFLKLELLITKWLIKTFKHRRDPPYPSQGAVVTFTKMIICNKN